MRIASLSATIASEAKSQLPEALRVDVPAASLRTPESPQSDSDVQGDRSSANQDDGGNSISSEELQVLRSENDELRRIVAQQDVELGRVGWVIVVTIPVIYALAVWVLSLVSHHA